MADQKRSLRNIINYILVMMGFFTLLLVWITVDQYQEIVVSEQQSATEALVSHAISDQLITHEDYLVDLGMTMQAEHKFRKAFNEKDKKTLHMLAAEQFHQYFTTTGLVDLLHIIIYDDDFSLLTQAGVRELVEEEPAICGSLIARAKDRNGIERNKPLAGLCQQQGRPYHVAIVPIGGLVVSGYAAIVANPVNTLGQIHNLPQMPYHISLPSGETVFKTDDWPTSINTRNTVTARHIIKGDSGLPLLALTSARDITKMTHGQSVLVLQLFTLALLVTALFIVFTRTIFHKRIILPLMRLNKHMADVQRNQSQLGMSIQLSGCKELDELSRSFNSMARKLLDAQRELHNKAHTDSLTGLPNREGLYSRMEQLESLRRREDKRFSLLMMDLNNFKNVNDTMGHHAGDELIHQVGRRIVDCLRASDTVARLGGDEFAVLLPTTENREDAIDVSKKIIERCTAPYMINGTEVSVGISIGIAIYPDTAEDSDFLMRCADKSMYQAKHSRSGYSICDVRCDKHEVCHQGISNMPMAVE